MATPVQLTGSYSRSNSTDGETIRSSQTSMIQFELISGLSVARMHCGPVHPIRLVDGVFPLCAFVGRGNIACTVQVTARCGWSAGRPCLLPQLISIHGAPRRPLKSGTPGRISKLAARLAAGRHAVATRRRTGGSRAGTRCRRTSVMSCIASRASADVLSYTDDEPALMDFCCIAHPLSSRRPQFDRLLTLAQA